MANDPNAPDHAAPEDDAIKTTIDRLNTPAVPNKFYDALKFIALIALPALAAAFFTISQIWGIPKGSEIVGTITVIDTLLGTLLKLSSTNYNNSGAKYNGAMIVQPETDDRPMQYSMQLNGPIEDLQNQHEVALKVIKQ